MKTQIKQLNLFFSRYENVLLLLFLAIISISTTSYFYFHNEILLYKDARAHLDIARRVVDSLTPGITQIGSVWLPLYQLLEIPFIWNNFLWRTGLAGSIISGLSYIGASFFMYKILYRLTQTKTAAFIGMLFFALNPNLLYLQAAPLDEVTTLFFINGSLYFLLAWSQSEEIYYLLLCAFFTFMGTLVRYEAWFFVIFELLYILILGLVRKKQKRIESHLLLFSTLAFFGIALWFFYNFLIWHNPFYFLNGQFSAKTQQLNFIKKGLLNTKYNFLLSCKIFLSNFAENAGYITTIETAISAIFLFIRRDTIDKKFFYFITFTPALFILLSLFMGITILYTKFIPLPGTIQVFNVRYGILAIIPTSIILTTTFAIYAKKINLRFFPYLFLLLILFSDMGLFYFSRPIAVIADGKSGLSAFGLNNEQLIGDSISKNCDTGLILISAGQNDKVMFASGLSMKSFIYEGSGVYLNEAIKSPSHIAECIVMTKGDVIYNSLANKSKLLKPYKIIYNIDGTTIYKK